MKPLRPPRRLVDLPGGDDADGAGRMARRAAVLPSLPAGTRELVKWRVRNTLRQPTRAPRLLRIVLAGAFVFLGGGVVGASVHRLFVAPRDARPALEPPAVATPPRRALRAAVPPASDPALAGGRSAAAVQDVPELPAQAAPSAPAPLAAAPERPALVASSVGRPSTSRGTAVTRLAPPAIEAAVVPTLPAPLEAAPVAPESTIGPAPAAAAEQAAVASALRALRVDRDAETALRLLDAHAARFPAGTLGPEAELLRAEALAKTGRTGETLAALDRLIAGRFPRAAEHRVLRGELRASRRAWQEAIADFDEALAAAPSGALAARALWGRAAVRSQLGDAAATRVDLAECLRRDPRGPFAARALRALEAGK